MMESLPIKSVPLSKRLFRRIIGYLPYLIGFSILFFSNSFSHFATVNGMAQLILFTLVVCIPAYMTKRMSYVDIGWPWGLVVIGVLTILLGEGYWLRKYIIGGMYMAAGLRMGGLAVLYLFKGHLKNELPRYQYQRRRWAKGGYTNIDISLQYEILIQCFANITFLSIPAVLQGFNPQDSLSVLEIIGYSLWALSLGTEHLADLQKRAFLKKAYKEGKKRQSCNVGLWKYSRHPNYFAEWMVWNSLILSSISSLIYFYGEESLLIWVGLLIGLFFVSRLLYLTLVYYTGAIPSEYYSLQKRPEYVEYQKTTNIFFPGKPKTQDKTPVANRK